MEDHVVVGQARSEVTCRHRGHMFIVISERRGTKHPWTPENKERNAFYAVSYELPRFCLQGNTSAEAIKKAKDAINFYKG